MTPAMEAQLRGMTDSQRKRMASDSRKALRAAWPLRRDLRAKTVIRCNVTMLRNLASL